MDLTASEQVFERFSNYLNTYFNLKTIEVKKEVIGIMPESEVIKKPVFDIPSIENAGVIPDSVVKNSAKKRGRPRKNTVEVVEDIKPSVYIAPTRISLETMEYILKNNYLDKIKAKEVTARDLAVEIWGEQLASQRKQTVSNVFKNIRDGIYDEWVKMQQKRA